MIGPLTTPPRTNPARQELHLVNSMPTMTAQSQQSTLASPVTDPSPSATLRSLTPVTPVLNAQPLPQSTPTKIAVSNLYTTNKKYRVESQFAMGQEMKKYFVGPMPPEQFLNVFFPIDDPQGVPSFTAGCYQETVRCTGEKPAYCSFVCQFSLYPPCVLTIFF
jgi:hypothetical protein